jgi:hypothetical protein
MQSYFANINGFPAYLYKARKELEALIDQEGVCSIWFSFLAANQQWFNLHQHLSPENEIVFENELEAAKFWQRMAANNLHLVDTFFFKRIQTMIRTFFGPGCFEYKWFWHRGELQIPRGLSHSWVSATQAGSQPHPTSQNGLQTLLLSKGTSLPQIATGELYH